MFSACAVNSLRMTGFFFFNDTATTEIYTLSLHDALPISIQSACVEPEGRNDRCAGPVQVTCHPERRVGVWKGAKDRRVARGRSEEHTSELQSHSDLVCRLLLEKKKRNNHSSMQVTQRPKLNTDSYYISQ